MEHVQNQRNAKIDDVDSSKRRETKKISNFLDDDMITTKEK